MLFSALFFAGVGLTVDVIVSKEVANSDILLVQPMYGHKHLLF